MDRSADRADPEHGATPEVAQTDPRDLIADHIPAMRAFALFLVRNGSAADDLVQDTIVKAWTNIEKFTPGTDMKAWLFTILRNTFFSLHRKRVREVADPDGLHAAKLSVRPAHDGRLAFNEFLDAFDRLSPEHREVLILVGANGYSVEEAAGMLGVAPGTVKSRTNRARARLVEMLGLQGNGSDIAAADPVALSVTEGLRRAVG
jgi:RNA polymerase sigma-70 factor (ECF subfamily)